jgi:ribosomal protein L11 methyltransferase
MNYIELTVTTEDDFVEIIIAELAELGFDSFIETADGVQAYVPEPEFQDAAVKQLLESYAEKTTMSYSIKGIAQQNWNAEWEKHFEPIEVTDKVYVRAAFHAPNPDFEYNIVITPKMSFGTGHHETTSMVMELQLSLDHQDKTVLDVGTGTGILSILAAKLGAADIKAFDIDEWSVENTEENQELNNVSNMSVRLGTIQDEPSAVYDVVLANINRNILLDEIPVYATFMKSGGYLIVSGFYEHDKADIQAIASKHNLEKIDSRNKNQWAAVVYIKH